MIGLDELQSEYTYSKLDIEKVKTEINNSSKELKYNEKEVINSTNAYKISGQNSLTIVVGFDSSIDEKKLSELKEDFRNKTLKILENNDSTVRESSYTNIGKSFGDYIKDTAVITLIIAIICITLYVAWTFSGVVSGISSYSFAAIVVITLFPGCTYFFRAIYICFKLFSRIQNRYIFHYSTINYIRVFY
ncbi:MAG: hypothetical protein Q9M97_04245 [Candidatus Gracilibacteria bacterium]|nr:hypothetical protein [Candidatus Gracilibacteria bacterium]